MYKSRTERARLVRADDSVTVWLCYQIGLSRLVPASSSLSSLPLKQHHLTTALDVATMPIAPITGKLRKRLWLDLSLALGLGVGAGYVYW